MSKLTAWFILLLGVLMVLAAPGLSFISLADGWVAWIMALTILAIGINELIRSHVSESWLGKLLALTALAIGIGKLLKNNSSKSKK